ncbi:MAG: hypothetical protein Q4P31_05555 [Andreesenia angusta]|nr:hypothetical protein [Andreesenia angusta]
MRETDIENLLLKGFQDELKNKNNSYLYQLFMIGMRCLKPDSNGGNRINFNRYSEELKLWRQYRIGENCALNSFVIKKNRSNLFDSSSFIRALPIFLSNQDLNIAISESFKISYYITEDIDTFFFTIINGIILMEYMNENDIIQIYNILKDRLISIPSIDYIRKIKREEDKLYIIRFEDMRIKTIQILDRLISEDMSIVNYLKAILENLFSDKIDKKVMNKIEYIYKNDIVIDNSYIRNIGSYIYKLRMGRISPRSLKFVKKKDKSIYDMAEGERFNSSILGNSYLSKIERRNNREIRYVVSKSGKYKFIREI